MIWEPPNKDIIRIVSLIVIRSKKYESDDEDQEKHRAICARHQFVVRAVVAEGAQLILYALLNRPPLGASVRVSRCALDEPRCHSGFYQLVVTSRRGL